MTKPIIVVKVPCKLLYVIQVKEFLIKCSTSWPYLISEFLVAYITIVASDWPRTFLHPSLCLRECGLHVMSKMDNKNPAISLCLYRLGKNSLVWYSAPSRWGMLTKMSKVFL